MSTPRILFVCLGNICRSPLVEGVARKRCAEAGLAVTLASCGTGGWHAGHGADPRMRAAARAAGFDLESHRARQLQSADFDRHDWLLAMDSDNLLELNRLARPGAAGQAALFLPWAGVTSVQDFPDPYYGEAEGFRQCVDLAERGVAGLIERLRQR
ncbi:phosphotyrosine protein phosphatase [Rhodanobacter sp. Root480]|uniref:low molecular weight protein-tyrosine-phosphatase n=1 Tax=Rhodanobacter sp. Root480 TaxID=1736542 RepID=UPI0006F95E8A|nr:low molecular weight protein-tyrosine-phosphatase [Rhodanobacter sp. Root480]KQX99715.1 phosphotyrosine protein phosphatase [Rhodanobacter sp. Root480]